MNEAARPEAEPGRTRAVPATTIAERRRLRPPTQRVGLLIAAAVVVGVALYVGREALSPFIVGLMLVYLLDPAVERLSRLRVPRWLSILLVYVIFVVVVWQAVAFTIRPLVEQVRTFIADLPGFLSRLETL